MLASLWRALKQIVSPSKTYTPNTFELSKNGKIILLSGQIQKLTAEAYIEELVCEYLKNKTLTGKPEYSNMLKMSALSLKEMQSKAAWFKEKLAELQA